MPSLLQNDRAGTHEEQRFEEGVGDEVEHADGDAAEAQAGHHVAELRNGGIGEDALDVVLCDGNEGSENRSGCADPGDDCESGRGSTGERASLHERIDAGNQVDASGDHGSGVNERGDGCGAFHRVGQPDVERKLAALARCPGKDEQADCAGGSEAEARVLRQQSSQRPAFHGTCAMVVEEQRARLGKQPDDSEKKEDVANPRGEEGFLGGSGGRRLVVPEADEQVGGEADQFPIHEQEQDAVRDNDAQHGPREEREKTEEAGVVLVVGHVASGVDEDEQADEADHHKHHGGEGI